MRIRRRRVKADCVGVVVSVRASDRCRVAIQTESGEVFRMCTIPKVKPGDSVKPGTTIGVV